MIGIRIRSQPWRWVRCECETSLLIVSLEGNPLSPPPRLALEASWLGRYALGMDNLNNSSINGGALVSNGRFQETQMEIPVRFPPLSIAFGGG